MNQSSSASRTLEARVRALELEYARLSERLRTVGAALGGAASPITYSPPPEARVSVPQSLGQRGERTASASSTASPRRESQAEARTSAVARSTRPKSTVPAPRAKKTVQGAQASGPRKWFEKGEALALFRGILKKPMPTRDLMVRVVAAKGKAQLPKKDLERFKWAVHAALKEAISANAIVRQDKGMIAVASGNVRVAGKGSSKTRK